MDGPRNDGVSRRIIHCKESVTTREAHQGLASEGLGLRRELAREELAREGTWPAKRWLVKD